MTLGPAAAGRPLVETAVIHGRFQPLHVGHLEYLLAGAATCRTLVVGITNADRGSIVHEATDPARGREQSNVLTYYERYLMVEAALRDEGVPDDAVRIVPFPHGQPERLAEYAPVEALYLLTIYDEWGEEKLRRFRTRGLETHVLWRRSAKVTSGTEVRRRLRAGGAWEPLVPPAVARVIRERGIDQRLRVRHG
jgi:cytidyltransferase-like protein